MAFQSYLANGQTEISALNDNFTDTSSLKNWQAFHQSEGWPDHSLKTTIDTSQGGGFVIEPSSGFWYGEVHSGPYYYKSVSGNFTIYTKVKAEGRNSTTPIRQFSLAGLMLRSPRPTDAAPFDKKKENWLFISTGYAKGKHQPQFETKYTVNSKSKLIIYPVAQSGWVEIAITRVGNKFIQAYKNPGANWKILRVIEHPQMTDTLQAGMLAYTDFEHIKRFYLFNKKKLNTYVFLNGKPDLKAQFDCILFSRPDEKIAALLTNWEQNEAAIVEYMNLPK
ncbi:DUF1349 domain-containing protein [Oscillatoria amoena NRMC-F 0135]|nr:DUF1349 domain-containing protein [Oscillatoria amoena NRMC-F 0135]